jgi:DNA repair exonuclease SbcCD ATPase subunit
MLKKHDKPEDRMEALLRLWGAEQSARQQDLPPAPPVLKPVRLDLRYALLCAGCVAAGAIVAIGAMLMAKDQGKSTARPFPLMAAKERTEIPKSEEMLEVTPETQPAVSEEKLLAMEHQLADMQSQRDKALARIAEIDRQRERLGGEKAELEKQLDQAKRVKQDVEQLDRRIEALRKEQDAALAMSNRLRKKLAASREQHRVKYQQMLEVHLAALAPNRQGLEAIQAAARASNLLRRCATLRAGESSDEMKHTLDRIEAVLLRLDFLHTDDVSNLLHFERQLQRGRLLLDIAAALPRTSQNRNLQIFLAEVDLILSGVQRVG